MSHTIRDKQKLKARASKIQGQVVALKKMLDEPHECAAVLQQIAAIRGAVNGLMREVIKGHLTEHIVHQGDELKREEDLDVVRSEERRVGKAIGTGWERSDRLTT